MSSSGHLWQPTLDAVAPVRWRDLTEIHRSELIGDAWIDFLPSWLTGGDDVLSTLLGKVDWRHERRQMYDQEVEVPRLTRHFGKYQNVPASELVWAGKKLTEHYVAAGWDPFVSAGLCLYRDGSDSVAWHGDRIGRGANKDVLVAILSLGSRRRLLLRPRGGGSSLSFTMNHGDLLVMGGSCQRTWDHCVPKTKTSDGPRISIQFRPQGVA